MLVATTGGVSVAAAAGPPSTTRLTVGDQVRPLNVEGAPLFGWEPRSVQGNDAQTGDEIRVTEAGTGRLVWDSGKVASSRESYVAYGGPALDRAGAYDWTVRTWDRENDVS